MRDKVVTYLHPGFFLRRCMQEEKILPCLMAAWLKVSEAVLIEILKGNGHITVEMAETLSHIFFLEKKETWIRWQVLYDKWRESNE